MGGHGGLNILPQKSWNVYGRENRLKVARDEAQHAEEEKIRMEKQREVTFTPAAPQWKILDRCWSRLATRGVRAFELVSSSRPKAKREESTCYSKLPRSAASTSSCLRQR